MKKFKWKIFVITALVCLSPIILGVALWDKLPDTMAIHFDINNNPDNFASKEFTVIFLPILMAVAQFICCFTSDVEEYKNGEQKKLTRIAKWIIPVVSVVLYVMTIGFSLGWVGDIRLVAGGLVGLMLIVTGSCVSQLDYVKNCSIDKDAARKFNRFAGIETVILGALFLLSILLPPTATVVCLFLLIPYSIITVIYYFKITRNKKS